MRRPAGSLLGCSRVPVEGKQGCRASTRCCLFKQVVQCDCDRLNMCLPAKAAAETFRVEMISGVKAAAAVPYVRLRDNCSRLIHVIKALLWF